MLNVPAWGVEGWRGGRVDDLMYQPRLPSPRDTVSLLTSIRGTSPNAAKWNTGTYCVEAHLFLCIVQYKQISFSLMTCFWTSFWKHVAFTGYRTTECFTRILMTYTSNKKKRKENVYLKEILCTCLHFVIVTLLHNVRNLENIKM